MQLTTSFTTWDPDDRCVTFAVVYEVKVAAGGFPQEMEIVATYLETCAEPSSASLPVLLMIERWFTAALDTNAGYMRDTVKAACVEHFARWYQQEQDERHCERQRDREEWHPF
jgi:hypothetical protein